MARLKIGVRVFVVLAGLTMIPALAHAQSTIAGVVKDPSGDVLPGVNVEAASPVLIEGVKSTTTDGQGNFKIMDLRPGTYVVTFTLQDFAQLKRAEVVVPADSTVTLNSEMKLDQLPVNRSPSRRRRRSSTWRARRARNSSTRRRWNDSDQPHHPDDGRRRIPGVTINVGTADVGGSNAAMQSYMTVRGIPAAQNVVMVDGMIVTASKPMAPFRRTSTTRRAIRSCIRRAIPRRPPRAAACREHDSARRRQPLRRRPPDDVPPRRGQPRF